MRLLWWRDREPETKVEHVNASDLARLDRAHRALREAKASKPRVLNLTSRIEERLTENRLGEAVAQAFQGEEKP